MKRVYVDGQNFLYKAAEILIEHGKISSKDELTKINIRSLIGATIKKHFEKSKHYFQRSR